jgi:hypothetical protein
LVEALLPALSENEWPVLYHALDEMDNAAPAAAFWWAIVSDRRDVAERCRIDRDTLAKLRALTPAQLIAAEEMMDRHWARLEA